MPNRVLNHAEFLATYVQTAAAGTAPSAYIFINPAGSGEYYQLLEVTAIWGANSTSGTVDVQSNAAAGTLGSGTTMLASTFDTSSGAKTSVKKALASSLATRTIGPGMSISIVTGGTLTSLAGLNVQLVLKPIRNAKGRF
jgi:hypothetical protein